MHMLKKVLFVAVIAFAVNVVWTKIQQRLLTQV